MQNLALIAQCLPTQLHQPWVVKLKHPKLIKVTPCMIQTLAHWADKAKLVPRMMQTDGQDSQLTPQMRGQDRMCDKGNTWWRSRTVAHYATADLQVQDCLAEFCLC